MNSARPGFAKRRPTGRGRVIVVSGPSGVGKTTLCRAVLKKFKKLRYSVSATSRPMRKGERDGREYRFMSKKKFENWIKKGMFIEHALVHGNLYGTPAKFLEESLSRGEHVLLDVDVRGGRRLMKKYPGGIFIFIEPPDNRTLVDRLNRRNTEKPADIDRRLSTARRELRLRRYYSYRVKNDDLPSAIKEVSAIINRAITAGGR